MIKKLQTKNKVVTIKNVKEFWENNPLCASAIPYKIGTGKYFEFYDNLREENEPLDFSYKLHEYKDFKDKKVLDVGCGNGYVLCMYRKEGALVTGIDITEKAVELCRKRFQFYGYNGFFLTANAEELPFENNTFDCVCSMGVLHHTPDTQKALDEIFRVLKPGGRVILMFYHKNSFLYQVTYLYAVTLGKYKGLSKSELLNRYDGKDNPLGNVIQKMNSKEC